MVYSSYQENIFDFIKHGLGNLVVEASAGAGKTSTMIKSIELLPKDKKILFCAFNRSIVAELKERTKQFENVQVSTVHGLGLKILKKNFSNEELSINEYKYYNLLNTNLYSLSSMDLYSFSKNNLSQYKRNILYINDMMRLNLFQTEKEAIQLINMYNVDIIADEVDVALKLMKIGKETLSELDYTDMIWLPNELMLNPKGCKFDYVFGDECQDFSSAQRELILKCRKKNTRFFFVGDENQCIYCFAGSDKESFRKLKNLPKTTILPLSISYRCPKSVVKLAKTYSNTIEYDKENVREGKIEYEKKLDDVNDGDLILCRNNYPLVKIYNELIHKGKRCFIRGKDIGSNLISFIDDFDEQVLNLNLLNEGLFTKLYISFFEKVEKIKSEKGLDDSSLMTNSVLSEYLDKIKALEIIAEGLVTTDELKEKISTIFNDEQNNKGIELSTIHKAKGSENKNVFIACRSLMPSKAAEQQWEIEQEKNLIYVAFTRSKENLYFLEEKNNDDTTISGNTESLRRIERKIRNTTITKSHKITDITFIKKDNTSILIPKKGNTKTINNGETRLSSVKNKGLGGLFKKKLTKINK